MPELPEVETTCRRLARSISGKRVRAVHVLRAAALGPQSPATLARIATDRTITAVRRRGKNILIELSGGYAIRVHLRMTGELSAATSPEITPAVRVWFELSGGLTLVFRDPRALGRIGVGTAAGIGRQLETLGPEPLSAGFQPEAFLAAAARSRQPAKLFLMDQTRVAGLGNIYAAEALFRAGIDPRRTISKVSPEKLLSLHSAIRTVLREAIGSATIAYKRPGKFQEGEFGRGVYAREGEPCLVCSGKIRRIEQGGRSTYYCPRCQR
jgi:formamidopyrimidine-DNA glycosylase